MLKIVTLALTGLFIHCNLIAQQSCAQSIYLQQQLSRGEILPEQIDRVENFIDRVVHSNSTFSRSTQSETIRIPVVVHFLYHFPAEMI
ncbi:MAG TPA: hypothetical protein VLJ68_01375, partial [Chitinophagaceae bacterium]|nr:hypothetical protein [Chitinophagaceae bacterium]